MKKMEYLQQYDALYRTYYKLNSMVALVKKDESKMDKYLEYKNQILQNIANVKAGFIENSGKFIYTPFRQMLDFYNDVALNLDTEYFTAEEYAKLPADFLERYKDEVVVSADKKGEQVKNIIEDLAKNPEKVNLKNQKRALNMGIDFNLYNIELMNEALDNERQV